MLPLIAFLQHVKFQPKIDEIFKFWKQRSLLRQSVGRCIRSLQNIRFGLHDANSRNSILAEFSMQHNRFGCCCIAGSRPTSKCTVSQTLSTSLRVRATSPYHLLYARTFSIAFSLLLKREQHRLSVVCTICISACYRKGTSESILLLARHQQQEPLLSFYTIQINLLDA